MLAFNTSHLGLLTCVASLLLGSVTQPAQAQPVPQTAPRSPLPAPALPPSAPIAEQISVTRTDSVSAYDQRLMQPLMRITELDSALAMSALPRLRFNATRELARATVLDHRSMGDSLRSAAWRQSGLGALRTRYASRLENESRHRLRLAHADVDFSYVLNAILLQQQTLRVIDEQLQGALQSESSRLHIAAARRHAMDRLEYAERLRRQLSGQRTTGR